MKYSVNVDEWLWSSFEMYIKSLYDSEEVAYLYDLDNRDIIKADLPFYKTYGTKIKGNILDLACGTGRVSLELVKTLSNDIYSIDLSKAMLKQFYKKTNCLTNAEKNRLHIMQGDMSAFSLDKTFELILLPFRAFQFLTDKDVASNCLTCIYNHLNETGIFIISVFKVLQSYDSSWIGKTKDIYEVEDPITHKHVKRTSENVSYDSKKQIIEYLAQYLVSDEKTHEYIEGPIVLKYYFYDQIKSILEKHKFVIVEEYGYYDKKDISDGSEMIFVCKKVK